MDHTLAEAKSLKSLEDLAVILTRTLLSLQSFHNTQVKSIEIGIMKEDMNERANTIAWDIRRLLKHYQNQLQSVLELLPDDFNGKETIDKLNSQEIKKAKVKTKEKENEIHNL